MPGTETAYPACPDVETVIGRLVTDPILRRRFPTIRVASSTSYEEQGYELTVEVEATAATDEIWSERYDLSRFVSSIKTIYSF